MVMRHAVLLSLIVLLLGALATTGCSSRTAAPNEDAADETAAPDAVEADEADAGDVDAGEQADDEANTREAGSAPQEGGLRLQLGGGSDGYGGYQGTQPRLLEGELRTP